MTQTMKGVAPDPPDLSLLHPSLPPTSRCERLYYNRVVPLIYEQAVAVPSLTLGGNYPGDKSNLTSAIFSKGTQPLPHSYPYTLTSETGCTTGKAPTSSCAAGPMFVQLACHSAAWHAAGHACSPTASASLTHTYNLLTAFVAAGKSGQHANCSIFLIKRKQVHP